MPHLQFETTAKPDADEKRTFVDWATERYADVMDTGTGHVAVTIRESDDAALSLGRAAPGEPVGFLNADVRAGRSMEQRRTFADAVIERFGEVFGIPADHCYVIYTEHPGEDFVLAEGPLDSWDESEGSADG